MLLGFHSRFVPMVLDGSKQHTIRAERKIAPKVGEICHCYTGLRTKGARLLGRWPCVKVEEVNIYAEAGGTLGVTITAGRHGNRIDDWRQLSMDERNALAWVDGFRSSGRRKAFAEMSAYWLNMHGKTGGPLEFFGHIIHWKWSKP
jgi:hypothetical protein